MNKAEKAVSLFRNNFNCAQSVLSVFANDLGLDKNLSLKIACPFGGGMGRMQKTCGAVTGAFMALGLKYGKGGNDDDTCKAKSYELVNEFVKEFIAQNGSIECLEILGHDMRTEEGIQFIKDNNLFDTTCVKMVKDAVLIAEKLMKN